MQVITYVNVNKDENTNIGVGPDGTYYRVNGSTFTAMAVKDVAREYLDRDLRVPNEFTAVRDLFTRLLS